MPSYVIHSSDRCFYCGRTTSGKTTAAKANLAGLRRWTVLDPKHRFSFQGVPYTQHYDKEYARQIIRVPFDSEYERWQDAIFDVWRAANQVLYVDELTLVNPSTRTLSPALGQAIRTGAERNLGVWNATQRPSDIPSGVFTECEHFFVFKLQYARDRAKVASFTTDALLPLLSSIKGHEFAYYNVASDHLGHYLLKLKGQK